MTTQRRDFMKELKEALEREQVPNRERVLGDYISLYDDTIESGKTDIETIIELGTPDEIARKLSSTPTNSISTNSAPKATADEQRAAKDLDILEGLFNSNQDNLKEQEAFTGLNFDEDIGELLEENEKELKATKYVKPKKRILYRFFVLLIVIGFSCSIPVFLMYFAYSYMLGNSIISASVYLGIAVVVSILASVIKKRFRRLHIANRFGKNA